MLKLLYLFKKHDIIIRVEQEKENIHEFDDQSV